MMKCPMCHKDEVHYVGPSLGEEGFFICMPAVDHAYRAVLTMLEAEGYRHVRQLPDGQWIGIMRMFYTCALCVGLDRSGYTHRYCYETTEEATTAIQQWDGNNDPPGPWIKMKGKGPERFGPGANRQEGETAS